MRHQLEGLAPPEREILDVASVCGREFLSPVIAHLVGRPDRQVEEDLRRLGRVRRLIVEGGEEALPDGTLATRYRFAHGLYRSVLREDLVASRRIEIHREVATRLLHHWGTEAPRIATEIARHCEEGRDPGRAVTFRGHAGDNAARLYAYAEAEEHYEWAFRSFEKLPAESRPAAAIALHRRRGTVRLAQARFDDATADFEAMLAVARGTGAPGGELAALAGLCDALFYGQRVEEMAARAQELLDAATRLGGAGDRAEAHARIGQTFVGQGRFEEAVPLLDDAIASARRVGAPVALKIALSLRGLVHYWQTEYQATETASVEALSLSSQLGDGFYALGARMFLGLARTNLGRISEALDDFADAISLARRNDDRYWLPRLTSHLGWVHRELGALDRAREYDTEAVRLARERPTWGPESEVLLNLCVDDVRDGQAERASALLAELQARAAGSSWMRWMSELRLAAAAAEHWAVRGDRERTVEHAASWRRWRSASARATTAAPPSGSGPSRPSRAARASRTRRPAWPRPSASCRPARPARGLEVGAAPRDRAAPARRRGGRPRGLRRGGGRGEDDRRRDARRGPAERLPGPAPRPRGARSLALGLFPRRATGHGAAYDAPVGSGGSARAGTIAAVAAFLLWGLFPLYWKMLAAVPAVEVVAHRTAWGFVAVAAWVTLRGRWADARAVASRPGTIARLGGSAVLIALNWLLYVWAVVHDQVVEASLGYFINPLVNVLLGVLVLGERLSRAQRVAVALAAAGVAILTLGHGRLPWIALALAVSFGLYGLARKTVGADAVVGLLWETGLIAPLAAAWLVSLEARGTGPSARPSRVPPPSSPSGGR